MQSSKTIPLLRQNLGNEGETYVEVAILITLYNSTGEGDHQGGARVILTTHGQENI